MKNESSDNQIGIDNNKDMKIFQQEKTKKDDSEINKAQLTESTIKENFNKIENKRITYNMKIVIAIIYFIIIILLELFYRKFLFEQFIPFQEYIQKERKIKILLNLCKILSIFGAEISTLFIFGIIFIFMPLNYSFLILQAIVYSSYITNTLKMIYQSDRPNWHSDYLTFSCNYGYGNPSGHSLTSISLYLSLSHVLIKYFKIKGTFKKILFIFFTLFPILIAISRFILAAHSLNQIIYGILLGLGLYYILIYIIGYHKYSSVQFFRYIRKTKVKYIYYFFHILLLIIAILIYLFIPSKDNSYSEENIFNGQRCKIKNDYAKYKNDGLFQSLSITSIIGAQIGIDLLFKILKIKNYLINVAIIEWNKKKFNKKILLRIPIIIISSIGIILYFIFPGNLPLILIFIFKSAIPFLISMIGIHSLGIYLCISLKIANNEIYKMDALNEISA
jgi:membrane-associated phospholipid phosphatase